MNAGPVPHIQLHYREVFSSVHVSVIPDDTNSILRLVHCHRLNVWHARPGSLFVFSTGSLVDAWNAVQICTTTTHTVSVFAHRVLMDLTSLIRVRVPAHNVPPTQNRAGRALPSPTVSARLGISVRSGVPASSVSAIQTRSSEALHVPANQGITDRAVARVPSVRLENFSFSARRFVETARRDQCSNR